MSDSSGRYLKAQEKLSPVIYKGKGIAKSFLIHKIIDHLWFVLPGGWCIGWGVAAAGWGEYSQWVGGKYVGEGRALKFPTWWRLPTGDDLTSSVFKPVPPLLSLDIGPNLLTTGGSNGMNSSSLTTLSPLKCKHRAYNNSL